MEKLNVVIDNVISYGVEFGKNLIAAVLIWYIGSWVVKLINNLVTRALNRRDKTNHPIDPAIKTFLKSLISISLKVLLLIAAISALGIETTSFAALLAAAGVAVGMALSGNLQNFAGGVMVLLFRPYSVGDFIEVGGFMGTVSEIQIFHTILLTIDNKTIFVPNSTTSSKELVNYSRQEFRRVDLTYGVEYGTDYERVKKVVERVYGSDDRVLKDKGHELFVGLISLSASSVDIVVRAWVKSGDYWGVYFDMQRNIYEAFNAEGINFPFPQLTLSGEVKTKS